MMGPEDFQQNNEHGGYPIVAQRPQRDWLEGFCWLSIALFFIGFIAAFTPMKNTLGALCPIGLAMFWVAGIIARRRAKVQRRGIAR